MNLTNISFSPDELAGNWLSPSLAADRNCLKYRIALPLLTAAAFLAGCAAPYKPPTSGPTATVVFQAAADNMTGTTQFYEVVADEKCSNPTLLATFAPLRDKSVVQVVPAESRVYFKETLGYQQLTGSSTLTTRSCRHIVSFVPRKGAKYFVRQFFNGASCSVEVMQDGDRQIPESFVVHPESECKKRAFVE